MREDGGGVDTTAKLSRVRKTTGSSTGLPTRPDGACPCGGATYDACCGPLLRAERLAETPEQLMRSRYTAHALGDAEHLWRTWHPRTRPERVDLDPGTTWLGLQVLRAEDEEVEFVAAYDDQRGGGRLHERSRFARRAGRWFYVEPV